MSPQLLVQLRRALAVSAVPEVVPDLPGAAVTATRPLPVRRRRQPEYSARPAVTAMAPPSPTVAIG